MKSSGKVLNYGANNMTVARFFFGVIFAILFTVFPLVYYAIADSWERFILTSMEREEFFVYHSVTSTKTSFQVGERITFNSVLETHRPLTYYWNDRLWCDYSNDSQGYFLVGRHVDELEVLAPNEYTIENPSVWAYNGAMPSSPGTCYLVSNIVADVGQGIKKEQIFTSTNFFIVE